MQGRGEKLFPLPAKGKKLYFFLICPKSSVSAGDCYREYDKGGNLYAPEEKNTQKCIDAFLDGKTEDVGRYLTNALYEPATRLNEEVEKALSEARSFSPLGAAMTGSGTARRRYLKRRNSANGRKADIGENFAPMWRER